MWTPKPPTFCQWPSHAKGARASAWGASRDQDPSLQAQPLPFPRRKLVCGNGKAIEWEPTWPESQAHARDHDESHDSSSRMLHLQLTVRRAVDNRDLIQKTASMLAWTI